MLRPKALDHLALKVTDMDKTLHFYHEVLGLELLRTSGPNAEGGRSAVVQAGGQKIDMFYRPDFVSADKENPVGMDHLCLLMDTASVEDLIAHLRQANVEVFWGPWNGMAAPPCMSMTRMASTWNCGSRGRRRHEAEHVTYPYDSYREFAALAGTPGVATPA
jgi:catechol 2,3-dioxygenase-like lactoylglutathione lyase family enzyme